MTTALDLAEIADRLSRAADTRVPIPPLTETYPGLDVDGAYRVQDLLLRRRLEAGETVRGRKVGLTSKAMQEMLGVDQPDFGVLTSTMVVEDGGVVDVGRLIQPRVESEIAFIMARPLHGPGATPEDARRAVAGAMVALEVIDSRIEDWHIALVDTVADNASCGMAVAGSRVVDVSTLDLRPLRGVMSIDGVDVAEGRGDAVLGDPLLCVAWLANALARYGVELREGDLVLAGSIHRALPLGPGQTVSARVEQLGEVAFTTPAAVPSS